MTIKVSENELLVYALGVPSRVDKLVPLQLQIENNMTKSITVFLRYMDISIACSPFHCNI